MDIKELKEKEEKLLGQIQSRVDEINKDSETDAEGRRAWSPEHSSEIEKMYDAVEDTQKQIQHEMRMQELRANHEKTRGLILEPQGGNDVVTPMPGSSSAFGNWILNGTNLKNDYMERYQYHTPDWVEDEARRSESLRSFSTTDGAAAIPTDVVGDVVRSLYAQDPIRQFARVRNTSHGNTMKINIWDIPKTGAGAVTEFAQTDESAAATEYKPVLRSRTLEAHYHRGYYDVPKELIQDSAYDAVADLQAALVEWIGYEQGRLHTSGSGTDEPEGILAAIPATGAFTNPTAAALTKNDVLDTVGQLGDRYHDMARWMFNRSTLIALQKLDTTDGDPLFGTLGSGAENVLVGYPYSLNAHMPSDATGGNVFMLFGALGYMAIRDVRGISFTRDASIRAANGEIRVYFEMRGDSGFIKTGNANLIGVRRT